MMSKNKTQKTSLKPAEFLIGVTPDWKQADCKTILAMMKRISGKEPKMWGPSIVGFGDYHYKYESGREGNSLRVGFSPRAQTIAIYIMPGYTDFSQELARLGKHKMGKSCLNIKRLSDIDMDVLEEICVKGLRLMEEKYPS